MKKLLSIIIPAYNEEKLLQNTMEVVSHAMHDASIPFEIVFVDDGSTDATWGVINACAEKREAVRGIRFSRNFGKESAIAAGLTHARGDCCVVMDCDLQHPPAVAVEMYKLWLHNGFDIIEGRKAKRGRESFLYKLSAGLFYNVLRMSSGINLENASDFKLLDRKVVDALNRMPERQTFFRAMPGWLGFKTSEVRFEVPDRGDGRSRWSFKGLVKLAVNAVTSYSSLPMQLVTVCGAGFMLFALGLLIQTLYMKLSGRAVEGFTTVIILLLAIGSVIMFSLGVIGIYISKIYEEVKNRPKYIVSDVTGQAGGEAQAEEEFKKERKGRGRIGA
jgi:glycosyltransferase involved in cell wall biosynthesis